jgi:hypothetical protein
MASLPRRFPRRRRAVRVSCDRIERLGADVARSDVNGWYSTRRCNHSWRLPPTIMPGSAERYCTLGQYDSAALRCRPRQADPAPKSYFKAIADVNFSAVTPRVSSAFSFVRGPPQGNIEFGQKGTPSDQRSKNAIIGMILAMRPALAGQGGSLLVTADTSGRPPTLVPAA